MGIPSILELMEMLNQIRFSEQYDLVRDMRSTLLEYCRTISPADFLQENSSFGRGSIRNLLVHNANAYEYWIGNHALQKNIRYTGYDDASNVDELEVLYKTVDGIMDEFIQFVEEKKPEYIRVEWRESIFDIKPMKLFTHLITHEFHHKGQILSLSRHLGYMPVDCDIIR